MLCLTRKRDLATRISYCSRRCDWPRKGTGQPQRRTPLSRLRGTGRAVVPDVESLETVFNNSTRQPGIARQPEHRVMVMVPKTGPHLRAF